MAKLVLSIGFVFPGRFAEYVPLTSKRAVLDADLVILRPGFSGFYFQSSRYQGKRSLTDDSSFQFKDAASHWRQQIQLAVTAGRTVIIFLPEYEDIWVDSGGRSYTGTGKNRQTTHIVEPSSNYAMLPRFAERVVASRGSKMKLATRGRLIQSYWKQFGPSSEYRVILEGVKVTPLVTTVAGEMPVACYFTVSGGPGRVVAVPALAEYDSDPSDLDVYSSDAERYWGKEDKRFGQKLVNALLELDEALRRDVTTTPAPAWTREDRYLLHQERALQEAILKIDKQVESAVARKARLGEQLSEEGKLRRLLFETGHALEHAIIEALKIIGFAAEGLREGGSEFDAVFKSAEGRFLGEAEGKDAKAINIDKLRQLEMNIQEDFAREEVTAPAKGVLFGNAYRLQPVAERPEEFFTEKCLTGASRSGTALVRTTDLFLVARHVKESGDLIYAESCRRALLEQAGKVVTFPHLPSPDGEAHGEAADDSGRRTTASATKQGLA